MDKATYDSLLAKLAEIIHSTAEVATAESPWVCAWLEVRLDADPENTTQISKWVIELPDGTDLDTDLTLAGKGALSLKLASRAFVLENGRVTLTGTGADLLADDRVRSAYLGL